ncbi:SNF2-related protein [Rapidithrix thailandica]|uniref:SNF2-related protein n=1 Tax=Rapidithrix thailandica TaxID=413964 RepID=A0AAW9S6B2_9BACT
MNPESLNHPTPNHYVIENFSISELNSVFIENHSAASVTADLFSADDILPQQIELNFGLFHKPSLVLGSPIVSVSLLRNTLLLSCTCAEPRNKLCKHQAQVLYELKDREYFRIFFDESLRQEKLRAFAIDYGLEQEVDLDEFFQLEYTHKSVKIHPKLKGLYPVNRSSQERFESEFLPLSSPSLPKTDSGQKIVVIGKHKYYDQLHVQLFEAQTTKAGKLKNPLNPIDPLDSIWKIENSEEIKFYSSISRFQHNYEKSEKDREGLKALVKNPAGLAIYFHKREVSDKITAKSLVPVSLQSLPADLELSVKRKGDFFEVSGKLLLEDQLLGLKNLKIKFDYFLQIRQTLYVIEDPVFLQILHFFKKNNEIILIHTSKFEEFQERILSKLEHKVRVHYAYVKPATEKQLEEGGFDQPTEQIIYLSDLQDYVELTPVMRYGLTEVPVLSKKQVHGKDQAGNYFAVDRNKEQEDRLIATLLRQHPDFDEQLEGESFYLHRNKFLEDAWFLGTMEEWARMGVRVLGFSTLKNNKYNPNRAKISVNVISEVNWFETTVKAQFGEQIAPLKQLYKAVRNKSNYVQLDDGTVGILPEEWVKKFSNYFEAGELVKERIRTPKVNFTDIADLYEQAMLATPVQQELGMLREKIAAFEAVPSVKVPEDLKATLRDYQKQGLNWLNFLDDFNFGGCLADDMGLGKTVQVIAFLLSQREKVSQNTNLVVLPTSLIFNWQVEIAKYAPSIKVLTAYGPGRVQNCDLFGNYEVILTTYNTLLSDIRFLKKYHFNYIILDESQAIKNPESQRYKAACLLQSRNKIVMTGTPLENNTFDLYGQLSFACPGLFGSKHRFKGIYSSPIDKFKNSKRAKELQQKISPFILRRTKQQVAQELPEKTEVVIYCEMGTEQRKIYEAYKKEYRDLLLEEIEDTIQKQSLHVLQGLTKLRQICNSPAILSDDRFYGSPSAKIEVLMEEVENKANRHKILIFSQFVTMLDLIKEELAQRKIQYEYLTGQTQNRADRIETFQKNREVRVFLISLKAGGTGLNLTEADYVYLVDPWWNPAVENQAIDRSHRIGQTKNVVAVRLICPDTIEEKIMQLQARKNSLATELVKTDRSMMKSLSKEELLALFE